MQMKISKKHIGTCILLCSLLLAYCSGFVIGNGCDSSGGYSWTANNLSALSGTEHTSMDGGTDLWHINYSILNNITGLFLSSEKPSEGLHVKTLFNILICLITAQIICLIYSSRLALSLCSQFNSIGIALYLHKKDGMK